MTTFNVKGTCIAARKIDIAKPWRTRSGFAGLGFLAAHGLTGSCSESGGRL
jgi:hypothetical protein